MGISDDMNFNESFSENEFLKNIDYDLSQESDIDIDDVMKNREMFITIHIDLDKIKQLMKRNKTSIQYWYK